MQRQNGLCKMVSLGRELKFTKTCEKRLYNHTRVQSVQKTASKNSLYSKVDSFSKMNKIGHYPKAIKPLQNGQFGSKIQIHKNMRKTTAQSHQSCSVQQTAPRIPNIGKMTAFRKWPKLATMQRLYSLCKMVSLGRKLKFTKTCEKRLYNHTRLILFCAKNSF